MKRTSLVWLLVPAGVLALCLFLRSEMERTRSQLRREVQEEITKAPTSALESAVDLLKKTPQEIGRALPLPTNGLSGTNLDPGAVASRLLDLAAQTAQKIDRVGLDATRMSDAEEAEAGAEMDKEITRQFPVVPDSPHAARLERLLRPILAQRQRKEIQYTVRVVESGLVNAFSLAGGYLYVTTAFLREFPADASVAMTMAHEVGHVELRHCVERMQYQRLARKTIGGFADIGQLVYAVFSTPYTKDQEFAADEYGYLACRQTGWASQELLDLLSQLEAHERLETAPARTPAPDSLETKLAEYFKSHPPTRERKRRLEVLQQ